MGKARKAKEPLYQDIHKRSVHDTVAERDLGYGRIKDYNRGYTVEMMWEADGEVADNQIFQLRIRGRGLEPIDLFLDAEQVMKFLRWV